MNALAIINKYYSEENELKHILLTHSRSVADKALQIAVKHPELHLDTGRTHQIRVHMRYIDHPIVGDEKYGYRRTMKIGGQLLHAHQLEFVHPSTGEKMVVEAEIPQDFAEVLQRLRAERDA